MLKNIKKFLYNKKDPNKVHLVHNFLSNFECDYLINKHKNLFLNKKNNNSSNEVSILNLYDYIADDDVIKNITSKLIKYCHDNVSKDAHIDYHEVVLRTKNSTLEKHLDKHHQIKSIIIYLNDNYDGGETIINDYVIRPQKRMLISFSGNKLFHGMNEIRNGNRYVLTCWYTDKIFVKNFLMEKNINESITFNN